MEIRYELCPNFNCDTQNTGVIVCALTRRFSRCGIKDRKLEETARGSELDLEVSQSSDHLYCDFLRSD